jgi:hypothetical protein
MKTIRNVAIVVFLSSAVGAIAQGTYLAKGQNGFGGEAQVICSLDAFKGVDLTAGYSICGILDVGLDMGYGLGELSGTDSSEVTFGFAYDVSVLKQSSTVPVSLQLMGSYGLASVSSDYLEANDLVRRATGYTIGLTLSRNFRLTSYWLLRISLLTDYESTAYRDTKVVTTADLEPMVATIDQERVVDLFFGGGLGFVFVFRRGSILAIQAELRSDQDLELQIRPILGLAFPQK